ncbi:LPS export ABC transporter permease LptF [Pontivivens ytuae]|uniref:LPS export ABC transporter permease LptF n=1 Tax=Pontivivens ytuae TaxID=2789856 RepID=A0A7S9LS14_9RHOB|nr:LPS export ABC transporter permease LptF [Pontivivens ytuae]QPH53905.1 LPS export ABC transporter permease LptF [Pontivivens ytuae]
MRQLDRYVLAQLMGPLGFFALIFAGLVWLTQSLQVIDTIVASNQSAAVFLELSALLLPSVMTIVLPISAFAASLFAINRLLTESELVVMMSAGRSPLSLARPMFMLGLVAMVLTGILTLYLAPNAARELRDRTAEMRAELANSVLREGRFNHPVRGVTVYVRQANSAGDMLGIFIQDARGPGPSITYTADQARLVQGPMSVQVILFDGTAQRFEDGGETLSLLEFERLAYDLGPLAEDTSNRRRKPREYTALTLIDPPDELWEGNEGRRAELIAEGHDQISGPLYALAFPILALAAILGGSYRRAGFGRRIAIAVGIALTARIVGLGLVPAVEQSASMWPILYAPPLLLLAGSSAVLWRRGRRA